MSQSSVQRVRYPPFEQGHMDAGNLPIVEAIVTNGDVKIPDFKIGNEDNWFVEWRQYKQEDEGISKIDSQVSLDIPRFISRSRNGWYVNPDPLHNLSRRLIFPTVSLVIISLFIHAIEPWLLDKNVISTSFAGSVSLGPLDYPRLLLYSFPLFLMPLIFRTIANFRDMSRQNKIIDQKIDSPEIKISENDSGIKISMISYPESFIPIRSRLQVGVAVPERDKVLDILGRKEDDQPSPGMSTKLPEKRISTVDEEGIGVGEATPMQLTTKRSVILEPFRIMTSGDWESVDNGTEEFEVLFPRKRWPGSIYSSLIAIHWELIIEFHNENNELIKWVKPLIISQSEEPIHITEAPVRSGRAELSNY
ncbi:MAG: hypothetical protein CMB61_01345 [Euryarchaeota archaeon]|nr:hypothetical protein [Euryarchaeota archaeon]